MSIDSATVIIRSVGERTEALCKKIILDQGIPEANVFTVRETPFSAAMKKSFEIGIEHGLPWTLCVDADVLLRENVITKMINVANKQKSNVCEIQGFILDKFFGGARYGGPHLYRTNLLPKVLKAIPAEGVNIRPETYALNTMKSLGFPWHNITLLTGLHDFEQYNRDIFRNSMVKAHKHFNMMELFVPYWREEVKTDYDYFVALSGWAAGIMYFESVFINVDQPIYSELFTKSGIEEKQKLDISKYSLNTIEMIINNWQEPEEYINKYSHIPKLDLYNVEIINKKNRLDALKRKCDDFGFVKLAPWLFGKMLINSGNRICKLIEGRVID